MGTSLGRKRFSSRVLNTGVELLLSRVIKIGMRRLTDPIPLKKAIVGLKQANLLRRGAWFDKLSKALLDIGKKEVTPTTLCLSRKGNKVKFFF